MTPSLNLSEHAVALHALSETAQQVLLSLTISQLYEQADPLLKGDAFSIGQTDWFPCSEVRCESRDSAQQLTPGKNTLV